MINNFDISLWIIASKLVLHNGSTTGIQSYMMGKPVIIYSTKMSDLRENTFPNKYGLICKNKKKILEHIMFFNFKMPIKKIDRIHVSESFISNEIVKIIKKIKVIKSNKYKSFLPVFLNLFFISKKLRNIKSTESFTKTRLRSNNEKIPGGLKKDEIEGFIRKLEVYFNLQKALKIKYAGPNCFLIYEK